ncbi:hypothetical protein ACVWZL_009084 [Bradyrhizobium sp. GM2.4]
MDARDAMLFVNRVADGWSLKAWGGRRNHPGRSYDGILRLNMTQRRRLAYMVTTSAVLPFLQYKQRISDPGTLASLTDDQRIHVQFLYLASVLLYEASDGRDHIK